MIISEIIVKTLKTNMIKFPDKNTNKYIKLADEIIKDCYGYHIEPKRMNNLLFTTYLIVPIIPLFLNNIKVSLLLAFSNILLEMLRLGLGSNFYANLKYDKQLKSIIKFRTKVTKDYKFYKITSDLNKIYVNDGSVIEGIPMIANRKNFKIILTRILLDKKMDIVEISGIVREEVNKDLTMINLLKSYPLK